MRLSQQWFASILFASWISAACGPTSEESSFRSGSFGKRSSDKEQTASNENNSDEKERPLPPARVAGVSLVSLDCNNTTILAPKVGFKRIGCSAYHIDNGSIVNAELFETISVIDFNSNVTQVSFEKHNTSAAFYIESNKAESIVAIEAEMKQIGRVTTVMLPFPMFSPGNYRLELGSTAPLNLATGQTHMLLFNKIGGTFPATRLSITSFGGDYYDLTGNGTCIKSFGPLAVIDVSNIGLAEGVSESCTIEVRRNSRSNTSTTGGGGGGGPRTVRNFDNLTIEYFDGLESKSVSIGI